MLRGCQREMIVLQTQDRALFESAWFVLRREREGAGNDDMLAEANRIIGQGTSFRQKKRRSVAPAVCFLLGLSLGMLAFLAFWLIVG